MSAGRPPTRAASFDEFIASSYVVIVLHVDVAELHLRRTFSIAIKEADFKCVGGGEQPQAVRIPRSRYYSNAGHSQWLRPVRWRSPIRALNVWHPHLNVPTAMRDRCNSSSNHYTSKRLFCPSSRKRLFVSTTPPPSENVVDRFCFEV